jgi:hypothetical protein
MVPACTGVMARVKTASMKANLQNMTVRPAPKGFEWSRSYN